MERDGLLNPDNTHFGFMVNIASITLGEKRLDVVIGLRMMT